MPVLGSELWFSPVHIKYIPVLGCEMMKEYDGSELWYPTVHIQYIPVLGCEMMKRE